MGFQRFRRDYRSLCRSVALENYIHRGIAERLAAFDGWKILFIQDEYDSTETARNWLDLIGFNTVFTCVPDCSREYVYPKARFPGTEFVQTLTGFVPDDDSVEQFARPIADRCIRIGSAAAICLQTTASLAARSIGLESMSAASRTSGKSQSISRWRRKEQIYGTDWYKFIGSARATLGTESGSNIFDFPGKLLALARELKDKPYEEVYAEYFAAHEGPVRMNQISPRIFEAIRLRTALVLFEGDYSGVVKPDVHFIPLKKDYSNIEAVFEKLEDIDFLEELTTRAYNGIIKSGRYSYKQFVTDIDRYIDSRVFGPPRAEIILAPIARRLRGSSFEAIPYRSSWEFTLNSKILGEDFQRLQLTQLIANSRIPMFPATEAESIATLIWRRRLANNVTRLLPPSMRRRLAKRMRSVMVQEERSRREGRGWTLKRIAWRLLPKSIRVQIAARVRVSGHR